MGTIWSNTADAILSVGRSLADVGVRNWALTREQALAAFDQLLAAGIGVFGGDVYKEKSGNIQISYDNWYCDPDPGEQKSEFAVRSVAKAREYIIKYKTWSDEAFLFAIVPDA
jgi:hypothetical protein